MLIHLRELYGKQDSTHLSDQLDITDIVNNHLSIHRAGLVHTEADAIYEAGNVRVNAHVQADLELNCSRCLTAYEAPLDFSYTELFSNESPKEDEEPADIDHAINYVTEDKLSLAPYTKEHILLELPMFPICSEHCKGLCPNCGVNLNEDSCNCSNVVTDPRWSGLKDFLKS
ncbi:MAG: DUF177 domain-containing protein [Paenibacillaceae bacterium]